MCKFYGDDIPWVMLVSNRDYLNGGQGLSDRVWNDRIKLLVSHLL